MKRDTSGRFLRLSFKDKYPTGRKHCGRCRRWRPVSDFSVAQWEDYRRECPHKLQSRCQCCERVRVRTLHGHHQRQNFNPNPPGTPEWHAWRRDRKRERYHELRKDKEWVELRREYYRIYGEAKRHENSAHPTDP